jgi:hypothetical protein
MPSVISAAAGGNLSSVLVAHAYILVHLHLGLHTQFTGHYNIRHEESHLVNQLRHPMDIIL